MFTALALSFLFLPVVPEPDPAGFKVNLDVSRGVSVAVLIEGKEIKAGTLYRVEGLPGKVKLKGKAMYVDHDTRREFDFEIELTPGYVTEVTLTIRANPTLVLLC